jgi:hypothetical protein
MSSGSCLTSKLSEKIIKMTSKSHETIPLSPLIANPLNDNESKTAQCNGRDKNYLFQSKILADFPHTCTTDFYYIQGCASAAMRRLVLKGPDEASAC